MRNKINFFVLVFLGAILLLSPIITSDKILSKLGQDGQKTTAQSIWESLIAGWDGKVTPDPETPEANDDLSSLSALGDDATFTDEFDLDSLLSLLDEMSTAWAACDDLLEDCGQTDMLSSPVPTPSESTNPSPNPSSHPQPTGDPHPDPSPVPLPTPTANPSPQPNPSPSPSIVHPSPQPIDPPHLHQPPQDGFRPPPDYTV